MIYYLASMTTNDETFLAQAGAQRKAAALGVALVCNDNSPRDIPGIEALVSSSISVVCQYKQHHAQSDPATHELPRPDLQSKDPTVWHYGYSNSWYLNASVDKFHNFQIRQWVAQELPQVVRDHFPQLNTQVVRPSPMFHCLS